MLKKKIRVLIDAHKDLGWVLEPSAKAVMKMEGLDIPEFVWTGSFEKAEKFLKQVKGPVVAKAVSKKILHKTECKAVVTGITSGRELKKQMERLLGLEGCEAVLVEEMVQGLEVIIGAKNDFQFGPVVVFGMGGTSVEIYNDTAIRMAPLKPGDVFSMADSLKAKALLSGYRGRAGVNMEVLTHTLVRFSHLVMELENDVESMDLNPVICTRDRCIIADARMMLKKN
nr:acetyl-CoA synthetase [Desulfobacula sp.]